MNVKIKPWRTKLICYQEKSSSNNLLANFSQLLHEQFVLLIMDVN